MPFESKSLTTSEWEKKMESITLNQSCINNLILSWLIISGHRDAAIRFNTEAEIGLDLGVWLLQSVCDYYYSMWLYSMWIHYYCVIILTLCDYILLCVITLTLWDYILYVIILSLNVIIYSLCMINTIDLDSMTDRMNLRNAIISGRIDDAIHRVNELNPEVLLCYITLY